MQAPRIQVVLDRDNMSLYIVIREPEDIVTYNNNTLTIQTTQNEPRIIYDISSLEVENPLGLRRYFRIAPGVFSGFGMCLLAKTNSNMHFVVTYKCIY